MSLGPRNCQKDLHIVIGDAEIDQKSEINFGRPFFKVTSICMEVLFTMLRNHPCLFCGHDFTDKKAVALQI